MFDACIFHSQAANTLEMMRQCPEVSFILDHIGKPGIKAGLLDRWRAQICEMAALPNVVCKLSGVTTEAEHKTWTRDQLRPYIDHVIACFGPDRILYGGDWPVSELAGSYLQWLTTLDWATAGFSPTEKRKLFRDNAIKAYRLDARWAAPLLECKGYSIAVLVRQELLRMLFDMVDGAAGDEITMRNNEAALGR